MDNITCFSLLENFALYLITLLPSVFILINKKCFTCKKNIIYSIIFCLIVNSIFAILINNFSNMFFHIFSAKSGITNLATYMSKILFITCSFFSLELIYIKLLLLNENKKLVTILAIAKITTSIIFFIIGFKFFSLTFALYSLSLIDLIYFIINTYFILKIFRNQI